MIVVMYLCNCGWAGVCEGGEKAGEAHCPECGDPVCDQDWRMTDISTARRAVKSMARHLDRFEHTEIVERAQAEQSVRETNAHAGVPRCDDKVTGMDPRD